MHVGTTKKSGGIWIFLPVFCLAVFWFGGFEIPDRKILLFLRVCCSFFRSAWRTICFLSVQVSVSSWNFFSCSFFFFWNRFDFRFWVSTPDMFRDFPRFF
ncbi:hypothetical protein LEP1GSC038_2207 [Leptospira weilii str. 2006001855]|uniref:Uncharacterized protein n=1 Tax=Leptospira weilii str. 2006001855 TaxID=996804 RepID=M6FMD1_9LEPT|nr:hypothetical protein LEP1GSC038_2207 [Leptospira weilii str. 2006001855]